MRAARTRMAKFCQDVRRISVVNDVLFVGGGRFEAVRMPKQVVLAERDAVRVDQRLCVALPDPFPAHLVRRRQIDHYGLTAGFHDGRRPQGTLLPCPEPVVDYDFVSGRQELLDIQGDVFEDGRLPDKELAAGKSRP